MKFADKRILQLMRKNQVVCNICRDNGCVEIISKLPFGLWLVESSTFDDRINNRSNFDNWCANRMLTLDRAFAKEILNYFGLQQAKTDRERADIVISMKALSLNDCYWVKHKDEDVKWEDVNLFDNSLSNALTSLCLKGETTVSNGELIARDIAADGLAPKAWRRVPDGFQLYKGDVNDSVRREVEASQILKEMGFDVVEYEYAVYDNSVVSKCKCVTSQEFNFVTAADADIECANEGTSHRGLANIYNDYYDAMILADYLVGNSDRHSKNWGYTYNPDNMEVFGLFPLFDFDYAFTAREDETCLPERMFGRVVTQFEAAKCVWSRAIVGQNDLRNRLNFCIDFEKYVYGSEVERRLRRLLDEVYLLQDAKKVLGL